VEIDSNNLPVFHSPSRLLGRSELESSRKNSRKIIASFVLALTNMGLGDQAAAFKLIERAMAVIPIKTDAVEGPFPTEILARLAARVGEPDRAIAALRKLLSIPYYTARALGPPFTPALFRLDPFRSDPAFQKLCEEKQP